MVELTAASFDIAKNGEVVAVLTLVKTAYRLGETVLGVVSFNEPRSHRRVLKVSVLISPNADVSSPHISKQQKSFLKHSDLPVHNQTSTGLMPSTLHRSCLT